MNIAMLVYVIKEGKSLSSEQFKADIANTTDLDTSSFLKKNNKVLKLQMNKNKYKKEALHSQFFNLFNERFFPRIHFNNFNTI